MTKSPLVNINKIELLEMNFGDACQEVLNGKHIRRLEWEDKNARLALINEQLHVYRSDDKKFHPLIVGSGDIAGDDWVVIDEKEITVD